MKKTVVVLLHAGYWVMFLLLLLLIFALIAPVMPNFSQERVPQLLLRWCVMMSGFAIVPGALGFYTFYSLLFTRLLARKKIFLFLVSCIGVAQAAGIIGGLSMLLIIGPDKMLNDGFAPLITITIASGFGALMNGIIGLVMKGFISWYGDIRLKEELNKKNFEMELALVKSQLSPHFLFNTLNNIDVLIQKDPVKASTYLNQLSDIMRFMLYETKTEKIPLEKELAYIEKYIALQRIRTSNPDYVNYHVTGNAEDHTIEPMLFIPFIENAFKHAENKRVENAINISFVIEKDKITFECGNHYNAVAPVKPQQGGLGNELIRKRLALLYPAKHEVTVIDQPPTYTVKLALHVGEN